MSFPLLLVIHPSVPANSVNEVIALARAKPGALTFSSPGVGNGSHLAVELFAAMANVQLVHVPYKGTAPAATALLAGEVSLTFSSIPTVLPHVRAGKLRALGVGNATRVPALPEFPTIAESGVPGYEAFSWAGVIAPTGTPRDVVARLNREIAQMLRQKDVADQLANEGTLADAGHAGGIRRLHQDRAWEVGCDRAAGEDQAGVIRARPRPAARPSTSHTDAVSASP